MTFLIACLAALAALAQPVSGYAYHEKVDFHVNTVGPVNNFAETYNYFTLPWCDPIEERDNQRLGEVLSGEEKGHANYDIRFRVASQWQSVCTKSLTAEDTDAFITAIKKYYWFEFFLDGLSIKGPVGGIADQSASKQAHHSGDTYFLVTHLHFDIAYNKDKVIAVNITTDPAEAFELVPGKASIVEFSFSTEWKPTNVRYEDRHVLHRMFELQDSTDIHWLSVLNNLVMVTLLVGFLAISLVRVLREDIAKYVDVDAEDLEGDEDLSGWKKLHADVFRAPPSPMFLSAAIGAGAQIFVLCCCILLLALLDAFSPSHHNRGAVYAAIIFVYAFTASTAGYIGTTWYVRWGGEQWILNCLLIASAFTVPAWVCFAICNTTAIVYKSSVALPFGTILLMLLLVALVAMPLTVFGSWKALNAAKATPYKPPCKTNRVPREIPPGSTATSMPVLLLVSMVLSFSSIYIEVHYIFNSIWGPRVYTLFGMLAISFVLLLMTSGATVVGTTYFKLVEEDWRWPWRSFVTTGSTGWIVYAYSAYYFTSHSEMDGELQTIFFFSYTFLISYGIMLMLGSFGFLVTHTFVKRAYAFVKSD